MLQKINISFLKKKSNVFDNKEEDMSDESDYTKNFEAIFKNMKVSKKSTESISVKSRGKNINLHPLIIKLLNAKKKKKKRKGAHYEFDEVFNIFDQIDVNRNKLTEYKPIIMFIIL